MNTTNIDKVSIVKWPDLGRVIDGMVQFAVDGSKDLAVRQQAEDICKNIKPFDHTSEILAIYYWVCQNIRYINDPLDVEWVKHPRICLETRCGDCDDIAVLLAAMLLSIGKPAEFFLADFQGHNPPQPGHIFTRVVLPDGQAIPLDPVANKITPKMVRDVKGFYVIPINAEAAGYTPPPDGAQAVGYTPTNAGRTGLTDQTLSVYDYDKGLYKYYQAAMSGLPTTSHHVLPSRLDKPEGIARKLPSNAKYVAMGSIPLGVIAAEDGSDQDDGRGKAHSSIKSIAITAAVSSAVGFLFGAFWKSNQK